MNSMLAQVHSLPDLIREHFEPFDEMVRRSLDPRFCQALKRLVVTGCGDSHHTALNTELAFEALAGVPTEPMTALQFAHYAAGYLPDSGPGSNAVIGISVSGEVVRTLEAMRMARKAGATTIALTATPGSRLAEAGDIRLFSTTTAFPDLPGVHTPGVRSYHANQLVLFLAAIHIGEVRGRLTNVQATATRKELLGMADAIEVTIAACDPLARKLSETWRDANEYVYLGGGPNYGTALFSAAKLLEATGDAAWGQDLEEWAHLQYFARDLSTPTLLIVASRRDLGRASEIALAAKTVGRRVAAIAPASFTRLTEICDASLPLPEGVRDLFTPLVAAIPGELFAAHRADLTGEPFFRAFGGGRSQEGGGGISRIRTGEMLDEFQLD